MDDNFNPYHAWLGIPPAEQPADFYRLLGISRFEANGDVISNAADARMVYVRTFQSSQRSAFSQKILNELSAAKICLLDAQKKAAYDQQLQAKMSQNSAVNAVAAPNRASPGLQPLGPNQPNAQRPLPQAMPITGQGSPTAPIGSRPVNGPQIPVSPYSATNPGPAFFNPNVASATKPGVHKKSKPNWLVPAVVGGGVFLTGLLVLVAVFASGMFPAKQQAAKMATVPKNVAPVMPTPPLTPPPTTVQTPPIVNRVPDESSKSSPPVTGVTPTPTPSKTPDTPVTKPPNPPANVTPPENPFLPNTTTPQPPAQNAPTSGPDTRTAWNPKTTGSQFTKTGTGWVERGSDAGANVLQFVEKMRNEQFIEIFDGSRGVYVRLFADHCAWRRGMGPWRLICQGSWAGGSNSPAPGIPSPPLTAAPTIYAPASPGYCVRIQGADRIELANSTDLVSASESRTFEAWIRLLSDPPEGMVFGTISKTSDAMQGGFQIGLRKGVNGSSVNLEIQRDRSRSGTGRTPKQPITTSWYHIAMCSNWNDLVQVYINGENTIQIPGLFTKTTAGSSCWIGASPVGSPGLPPNLSKPMMAIHADLAAFRVSRGMRYNGNFTPPTSLSNDADTLALLDFSTGAGRTLGDSTGKGHTGTMMGGQWVPFSGAPKNEVASGQPSPQTNTPTDTRGTPTNNPETRTSLADIKKPKAPDADTYVKKQEEVHTIFGDEIKKAKKPDEKAAVAQRLIDASRKLLDDPDARYVMLDEARILAAEGNQLSLALQTVDMRSQSYDFNVTSLKLETLKKASGLGSTNDQRRQIMDALVALANSAADDNNFDVATDAVEALVDLAKKGKNPELTKTGLELKTDLTRRKKSWDEIRRAEERLAADPNDDEDNLRVGRFYCFVRNDWARGLKLLAKGGEEDLAKAARLEIAAAGVADAQFAAAEAWETAADSLGKSEKIAAQRRANGLYAAAIPSLSGLVKVRAQQKLDALADQLAFSADIHIPTKVVLANGSSTEAYVGMIGRVLVGTRDTGILVHYLPGRQIRPEKLNKLVQETKATNAAELTIQLIGAVSVMQDGTLYGNQRYEAGWDGSMRLLLDRKEMSAVKSNIGSGSRSKTMPITKGNHEVGWELLGTVANCELNVRQDNSFGPLVAIYYTKDHLEALRRKLVKGGKPKELDLCN